MIGAMVSPLQDVELWLVDSLVIPASLHDVEGRFLRLNAAAERASGKSNAELVGHHFTELLPAGARESVTAHFCRAAECGEPTDFETVFIDAGGHLRAVRAQHLPLRSEGAIIGVLILAWEAGGPTAEPIVEPQPRLTPRQSEVLELIASGMSTSEIAKQLTLSTETVRNHLRSVFRELNVHTRLEAIAAARRLGLLAPAVLGPQAPSRGVQTK